MRFLVLVVFLLSALSIQAQKIKVIKIEDLKEIIHGRSDQLKVVNFWASWCRPCIQEMPYFDELNADGVQVYFVSVDHPDDLPKAQRVSEKMQIRSQVYLLDEDNADKFISSINKDWSGAIPATLFINAKGEQYFYEQAFEKPELLNFVKRYSSKN